MTDPNAIADAIDPRVPELYPPRNFTGDLIAAADLLRAYPCAEHIETRIIGIAENGQTGVKHERYQCIACGQVFHRSLGELVP